MLKADLHIHSHQKKRLPYCPFLYDAVQTVEEILDTALKRQLKIISITDHDTLTGFFEAKSLIEERGLDILLLPGCEISTKDGHLLAYNINKRIKKDMPAWRTIDEIHAQGGLAVAPHPFSMNSLKNKVYELELDALEGLNAMSLSLDNLKSILAATGLKLPSMANSDAHLAKEIGRSHMLFPDDTTDLEKLIKYIKTANFKTHFASSNNFFTILRYLAQNLSLQVKNIPSLFRDKPISHKLQT